MEKIFIIAFLLFNIFNNIALANSSIQQQNKEEKQMTTTVVDNNKETEDITLGVENKPLPLFSSQKNKEYYTPLQIDKNKFLKWLAVQHNQGKYLELTEEMINSLTEEEFQNLITTEAFIKELMPVANENFKNYSKSISIGEEYSASDNLKMKDFDIEGYKNLYGLSEEKANSLIESIKQYTEEKKEALALVALGGVGGLALLKKGKELLDTEDTEDKKERQRILRMYKEANMYSDNTFEENYKNDYQYGLSVEDNLRNITEVALNTGIAQRQLKTFAKEQSKMNKQIYNSMDSIFEEAEKEVFSKDENYKNMTRREKQEELVGSTKVVNEWNSRAGAKKETVPSVKQQLQSYEKLAEELTAYKSSDKKSK